MDIARAVDVQSQGTGRQQRVDDRESAWRMIFCPKLASFTIAWWIENSVTPDNLTTRLQGMEPGDDLPKLMTRLRLFEPMYSSMEFWQGFAPYWGRAMSAWMRALVEHGVVVQHQHQHRHRHRHEQQPHAPTAAAATTPSCWSWCEATCASWRSDTSLMLAWVDRTLYSTADLDLTRLTQRYMVCDCFPVTCV